MRQRTIRQVFSPGAFNQRLVSSNRMLIPPGHWEAADPFLIFVEDYFQAPDGFPDHPHRGIETVTLVLDGQLRHADNRGNSGVLGAADVQWMTAGGGIIHAELPWEESTVHSLQLWLNLPKSQKRVTPSYQDLRGAAAVAASDDGIEVRVISGAVDGVEAVTQNIVPVLYLDVKARAGKSVTLPVPAEYNGFIHVLEGEVVAGPERLAGGQGDMLWLDHPTEPSGDSTLTVEATSNARFLVVTGLPLREPVVAYGPFVMNTSDEIAEAYADYHSGRFGGPTPAALEAGQRPGNA